MKYHAAAPNTARTKTDIATWHRRKTRAIARAKTNGIRRALAGLEDLKSRLFTARFVIEP